MQAGGGKAGGWGGGVGGGVGGGGGGVVGGGSLCVLLYGVGNPRHKNLVSGPKYVGPDTQREVF